MEQFGKILFVTFLALLFCLIDAAFATYILSWVGISFWHWYQIFLVAGAVIGSALRLHSLRN